MVGTKDFSIKDRLQSLLKLQKIDSKIDNISFIRGELPKEVEDLESEIEGLANRRTKVEEEINGINKYIEEKNTLIATTQELLKKYDKQSSAVKNNREYEAINKEIEYYTLEIKLSERHIKNATEELETKVEQLKTVKKVISQNNALLQSKQAELKKILAETEIEEKDLLEKSKSAQEKVEEKLLLFYKRTRNNYRNGKAIVAIERNSCSGCNYVLPPQLQIEVGYKEQIYTCENCGRIVVDKDFFDSVE